MPLILQERPPTFALVAAIEAQARTLGKELRAGKKPKRARVHRLRVATRRLLAALELTEAVGVAVPDSAKRRLRRLLDHLSPLRDAQVVRQALQRLPKADVDEALMESVRRHRDKQRKRAKRGLSQFDIAELERELTELESALSSSDGSVRENQLVSLALVGVLARKHLDIERRRTLAERASERELHRLRVALKGYRYCLEVLASLLPSSAEELLAVTTRLQDELGDAHDRHVLAELVAESGEASRVLAEQLREASAAAHRRAAEAVRAAELIWPVSTPQLTLLGHKRSAR
jgi:CHAD domain-containing protein